MNEEQKADIRALIEFYDQRGWDWTDALEFQVRYYNKSLPTDEWLKLRSMRPRPGRPRKQIGGEK